MVVLPATESARAQVPWENLDDLSIGTELSMGSRPEMPPSAPEDLAALARACWDQEPEKRPDCGEILRRLSR